jgi:hypothetical protein
MLSRTGLNAQERLEKLTWEGAAKRYPEGLPDNVATQLRHELNLIERMEYAPYFLTVELIVDRVNDLSAQLKTVSNLEDGFPLTAGRGDDAKRGGSGLDSREPKPPIKPRDMYEPDLHIDTLKVRARNFR